MKAIVESSSPRVAFTVVIDDPVTRARVIEALTGPGSPAGVERCDERDSSLTIEFCTERSSREIIEALIALERKPRAAEEGARSLDAAVRIAAEGLGDPAIGMHRILESYLGAEDARC